jgi:ABC-2 type transport system ATP-binding protein
LSGRANLELLARLDNNARGRAGRIDQALEQTGLVSQARTPWGLLRRDAPAARPGAALIRSPQLLFLDEPTSALDPAGARRASLARRLADEGAAVVLRSHDMTEVEDLCATLTVINGGQWCSPAQSTSSGRSPRCRACAPNERRSPGAQESPFIGTA